MHPEALVAGRWEILEPLGAGGVGDVYRARHRVSQVEVALELVRTRGGHSAEDAVRFEPESSAPAQIGHPGIARVLDAGVDPASAVVHGEGWIVGCSGRLSRFDDIRPTCRAIYESLRLR